jgi:hypothetical protein
MKVIDSRILYEGRRQFLERISHSSSIVFIFWDFMVSLSHEIFILALFLNSLFTMAAKARTVFITGEFLFLP